MIVSLASPQVVTTHTFDERFETCLHVREAGMELCCGALLGMGESDEQRVELLGQLREVAPAEVPINFLNPRPGTPLGDHELVPPLDPPRFCAVCGRKLSVQVTPGGYRATCRRPGSPT